MKMKKIFVAIAFALLLFSVSADAQTRATYDKTTGRMVTAAGIAFSIIAVTVPDGGNWTYIRSGNSPGSQQKVYKPFFQQPARVTMLGIGVTFSIGGLIFNHNNKR